MISDFLVSAWSQLGLTSRLLFVLWLLGMISLPVVKWIWGSKAERTGISVGVILQVSLVLSIIFNSAGFAAGLWVFLIVSGLGWLSEAIGCRIGFPFGKYHYTKVLQPQLMSVPVIIPLAWMMMMAPSWAVGSSIAVFFGFSPIGIVAAAISALAFTSWDLYLDPQMVFWDFWRWPKGGKYFGIPLSNYAGWLAVSFLITGIVWLSGFSVTAAEPLLLVFILTAVLQAIAQLVFWRLYGSGIIGLIGMGTLSILSILVFF
ncbi:carotenoid biosynthesis protein [Spirochaeta dissipatitropha]